MEEIDEDLLVEEDDGGKTCFLTGGSGFVGYNLLLELLEQEWHVTALYYGGDRELLKNRLRTLEEENSEKLVLVEGDILKVDSLRECMPEDLCCVYHLAGNVEFDKRKNDFQNKINIEGTKNVLEVAIEKKVKRFIQTSSSSVYGGNPNSEMLSEKSPKEAMKYQLNYGRSKYLGEKLVLEASEEGRIDAVVIQPDFILGENDILGTSFSIMFKQVAQKQLFFALPGSGSYVDVKQLAKTFISACENGRNGECYILGGENVSHKDLIAMIGKELKISVPQFVPPQCCLYYIIGIMECCANCCGKKPMATTEMFFETCKYFLIDSSKAKDELGYKITPIRDLIRREIKFMNDNGLLFENNE